MCGKNSAVSTVWDNGVSNREVYHLQKKEDQMGVAVKGKHLLNEFRQSADT